MFGQPCRYGAGLLDVQRDDRNVMGDTRHALFGCRTCRHTQTGGEALVVPGHLETIELAIREVSQVRTP